MNQKLKIALCSLLVFVAKTTAVAKAQQPTEKQGLGNPNIVIIYVTVETLEIFTSDETMQAPKVTGEFTGLHLQREVIDRIYRKNAEKWSPHLNTN
ncbi:MAG: hypothetical protein WD824_04305 [Cyclobacteriaceae bacterium]